MTTESTTPETTPDLPDTLALSWDIVREAGLNVNHAGHDGVHFTFYNTGAGMATTMATITTDPDHDCWIIKFYSRGRTTGTLTQPWTMDDEIHYPSTERDAMLAKILWWLQ